MSVLLKYQLKALFESGDLMTQDTLSDLIDSTYNPVLVAGTNVTLNSVTTPSGTTITVNAQGGGSGVVTSLTTTGSSGAATLNAGVLNIPIYSGGGTYTNATAMPQSFPGTGAFANIAAGTSFTNQTFTEMMNKMLYPTLNPSLSPPSSGMTKSPAAAFQEIGANITITLNSSFNQGSISPQYTSASNKRSGLPNTYNYTGAQVSSNSSTSTSDSEDTGVYQILAGAQSWTGSVSYDAGVMPKDSIGDDFDPPGALPAGTTSTVTQTITGVYPVFATTLAINTMTKQSLVSMSGYATVSLVAESLASSDRQTVDIPIAGGGQAGWNGITVSEFFSPLNNTFGSSPFGDWTQSSTTHEVPAGSGIFINYLRLTNNAGYPRGAGQYRFKS